VTLTPRQEIIQFLESSEGLAAATALFAAIALVAFALLFSRLRRIERAAASAGDPPAGGDLGRALASLLAVGCVLLPLVFTIASEDVFALPKTIVLWAVAAVIAVLLAFALARDGRLRRVDWLNVAVLAFAGLTVLATILSIDPAHSVTGEHLQYQGLLSTLAYVVLFLAARLSITCVPPVQGVALGLLASATIAGRTPSPRGCRSIPSGARSTRTACSRRWARQTPWPPCSGWQRCSRWRSSSDSRDESRRSSWPPRSSRPAGWS
jgi:hypothetical protein